MADKVCLMAFHVYPHGLVLNQEQPMSSIKDFQSFMPSFGAREEITKLGSLKLMSQQCEEPWKLTSGVPEANWFVKTVSEIERPALNVQDVHPDSLLFSCGIAEHFIRREKMLQFLRSGESEVERGGVDITLLFDLMGLHEMGQQPSMPSLVYPSRELNTQKPLLDFVGSLHWSSKVTVQPDGRVLFTGSEAEMKHLLSVVAEFYSLRNTVVWKKQSVLVPHFKSVGSREAGVIIDGTSFNMQATTLAPLKRYFFFSYSGSCFDTVFPFFLLFNDINLYLSMSSYLPALSDISFNTERDIIGFCTCTPIIPPHVRSGHDSY
ncbi:unnamed protein product [Malus baccata var. baccata]